MARGLLETVCAELTEEGVPHRADVPVGIMIEIPAAAVLADVLAMEADFFSIGTNDLIQYALAVDRMNEQVAYLYRPLHPAVLRLIRLTVEGAATAGIPVSVCGEMAGDGSQAAILCGLGIRKLSMSAASLLKVREKLSGVAEEQLAQAAAKMLGAKTAVAAERVMQELGL